MRQFKTHYDNLNVTRNAPADVIKAAYRALAARHHPDRNPGNVHATGMMGILNESFGVLSDEYKRAEHDRWIDQQDKLEADQAAALRKESQPIPHPPAPTPKPEPKPAPLPEKPKKKTISPALWVALSAVVLIAAGLVFFLTAEKTSPASKSSATVAAAVPATIKLSEVLGKISITTNPAGAKVSVDDQSGSTPLIVERLAPGLHKVTIRADGYADWTTDAHVVADQVMDINVTLEKLVADSTLVVFTNPAEVSIELNGPSKAAGLSPMKFENLQAGRYEVVFKKEGFPMERRSIDLKEGETKSFSVSFMPGSVMITSTPSGAEVVLNSRTMGRTPLALNNATPGRQNVELRLEGFRPTLIEGTLPSGQSLTLHGELQPRESPAAGSVWVVPFLDLEMLPVAKGTFSMGDTQGLPDEKPVNRVTLTRDFWLGKYLVTQKQWMQLMDANPSEFRDESKPVQNVSWLDAEEFCRKLNRQEASAHHLPTGYIYSLPTEAQWEYAARAGSTLASNPALDQSAWYADTTNIGPHAIGKKRPNAWDFYDLNGNVWEWCLDFKADYPPGPQMDPLVKTGKQQIIRGGSWKSGAPECRYAYRGQALRETRRNDLGFRLALIPDPSMRWSR